MKRLTKGMKESSLSFYEKTKRVNEVLLQLNELKVVESQSPVKIGNEFTDKIEKIIDSLKGEIEKKKTTKNNKSKIKIKSTLELKKMSKKKENKRPMTSKVVAPKRVKNSRIKSNITKLEVKKNKSVAKKSKYFSKSEFTSKEKQKRRIQSAYNGYSKTRKFRIRSKMGNIREPHTNFEMKYNFQPKQIEKEKAAKEENWKRLVNEDSANEA